MNSNQILVKNNFSNINLKDEIINSDTIISDLDGTIADPAKYIAIYDNLKNGKLLDINFIYWVFNSSIKFLRFGRQTELDSWREYMHLFLNNKKELDKIVKKFKKEKINLYLYPKVSEFYSLLQHKYKILMTRNISQIGKAFGNYLDVDEIITEAFDKESETLRFIYRNRHLKKYIIFDDYEDDLEAVVNVLKFCKRKNIVDTVSSFFVSDNFDKVNCNFDVILGRDYSGLVKMLV